MFCILPTSSHGVDFPLEALHSGPVILTYRDPANRQRGSLSHRVTSAVQPFPEEVMCLQARKIAFPIVTPEKSLTQCECKGKILHGEHSGTAPLDKEECQQPASNNVANIYPGFLRKGRTMSLAIQCVHNSSCPTAQMLPVNPRAPSYESCPARQRCNAIMLATIFSASSLPPLCISVQCRSLKAGNPVTLKPETPYWEDGGLSFRLTQSCHWGEQDNATLILQKSSEGLSLHQWATAEQSFLF